MKKLGILGSFACAVLLSACGGGDDAKTGDDQNLTEDEQEIVVDVEGYVLGDFISSSKDAGVASFDKACAAWKAKVADAAGSRLLDASCGEPEQLASFLFGAKTTASFLAVVPRGVEAVHAAQHTVLGKLESNLVDKVRTWNEACAAEVERARALHGNKLLSATCLEPTPDAELGHYVSAFETVTVPDDVGVVEIAGTLVPEGHSNLASTLDLWSKACGAWADSSADLSGAHLVSYECGAPTQVDFTTSFRFTSETRLRVQSGKRGATPSSGPWFQGEHANLAESLMAWNTACAAEIDAERKLFGERLLAVTCGELAHADNWSFEGAVNKIVAGAGETKVTVDGWVMSYASNRTPARADWTKRYRRWLDGMAGAVGVEHIEGHEAAMPEPAAEPNWFYSAPTKLHLGIDLAEGETLFSEVSKVTIPSSGNFDTKVDAWEKACSDAVAKAASSAGDAFVAAGCGKTTLTQSWGFESEFTVWKKQKQ
jgi:hypothetical protein